MESALPRRCAWSTGDVVERRLLHIAAIRNRRSKTTKRTSAGTGVVPLDGRLATSIIAASASASDYEEVVAQKWLSLWAGLFGAAVAYSFSVRATAISAFQQNPKVYRVY